MFIAPPFIDYSKRRELPAFRVGSDWRFNVEAIDEWRMGERRRSLKTFTKKQGE